jgi:DNA repair exonuclease SbcCD nuclease subunit
MSRVLFIGDPHLRINKFSLATQFLAWINKFIAEQKPDLVVNLGDSLDTHAVVRSEVLNELMKHIYHVIDLGIPYVYLRGNHDQYSPKDSKYHALLPFKDRIANLHIVDEPQDLFGMTFVPYLADGKDFPKKTQPICIAHQTFLGADYGPVNALEGVDANTISADIIISGHIHKKHNLGKVVYVGSPYSQEASDANQIKGISTFDTDTLEFSFTQTPMPSWRTIKLEISSSASTSDIHALLGQATSDRTQTHHYLLEITGPRAEVVAYVESAEYLKLVKGLSIRLKTVFTDKERKKVSINAVSMEQILSEFVDRVYDGSLDKDKVLQKAKEVLERVKSQAT